MSLQLSYENYLSMKLAMESSPLEKPIKGDILIVDDVPENLQVLFALLTAEGYEVRRLRSGKQVIKVVSEDPPDLILLDIRMPEMDGYEVCRLLKLKPGTRDIPIVFLSALDDVLDKVKAFSLGGADYISKPFQGEEVLARIQHQLTIRQQKQELIKARQSAELASKVKSEFLANMSHEVRTPLTAIIGYSQILKMTALDDQQSNFVDTVYRSSQELLALLDDILEFSRLEAERESFKAESFTLKEIEDSIRENFESQAQEKGLDLIFEIHAALPKMFSGPKLRLLQILKNLVQNAIKFTRKGYVRVEISPQQRQPSASTYQVRFSVKDTGCGISIEEQKRIFTPFTQVDASSTRQHGGVGLGLSICQKLLQRIGGTMHVESESQAGATFWFVLPLEVREDAHTLELPTNTSQNGKALDISKSSFDADFHRSVQLLLVEDEPDNQAVLTTLLNHLGYGVDIAVNGLDALEKLFETPYRIVLMDCQMPVMDGYEATQKLRQWEVAQSRNQPYSVPIIIIGITAYALAGDRERCLAAGMDDYMSKPISIEALQETLNRWVKAVG